MSENRKKLGSPEMKTGAWLYLGKIMAIDHVPNAGGLNS